MAKLFTEKQIIDFGRDPDTGFSAYSKLKTFKNGKQAYLARFIYTVGICYDLDWEAVARHRWCYRTYADALYALHKWDGKGSPKGAVKQKY